MRRITLGLAMIAAASLGTQAAHAGFTAYNDLGDVTGGNVTDFTQGENGNLIDFATATDTGVHVSITGNAGISLDADGAGFDAGTPGNDEFAGNVAFDGFIYYGAAPASNDSVVDIALTGLAPTQAYKFVITANRAGGSGYLDRKTTFTLQGADAFNNTSVTGGAVLSTADSATFVVGENSDTGYIARFTDILSGTDGAINMHVTEFPMASGKGFYISAFKLATVPEPASLALLGIGGAMMLIRRKR